MRWAAVMSSCTEFTFSSTPTQAPSPLPLQGRQRKETLGTIDTCTCLHWSLSFQFFVTHVVSFSNKNWTIHTFGTLNTKCIWYQKVAKFCFYDDFVSGNEFKFNFSLLLIYGLITFQEEIQKFKRQYIYKHILDTDARDHVYPCIDKAWCCTTR